MEHAKQLLLLKVSMGTTSPPTSRITWANYGQWSTQPRSGGAQRRHTSAEGWNANIREERELEMRYMNTDRLCFLKASIEGRS